jgi:serine/threonine-protein kinase HipA
VADRIVDVVVQIAGEDVPAGRLWAHHRARSGSATFEYRSEYLARDDGYALDPGLARHIGQQQTADGRALFGAFSDAAPDGWGRRLVRREGILRARERDVAERDIAEIDYLLGVRDDLRQGALRFRDPQVGTYLAGHRGVPHLIDLRRLLGAAEQLERDEVSDEDLRILLDGGSSLGGARPKAHVIDGEGRLGIAKFPAPAGDEWDVIRWEAVALKLARDAGIQVPRFDLHDIDRRPVLIVRRFDRDPRGRIGYVSAMTMLEAIDGEHGSYLEIAEAIEERSSAATADLRELWRRIVFSRLISNTDDHLRNHGFLRTSTAGWALSPAFDLNPDPNPGTKRFSTAIDESRADGEIEIAVELADLFRLTAREADEAIADLCAATSRWRDVAVATGLSQGEIERMSGAFEHERAHLARERAKAIRPLNKAHRSARPTRPRR